MWPWGRKAVQASCAEGDLPLRALDKTGPYYDRSFPVLKRGVRLPIFKLAPQVVFFRAPVRRRFAPPHPQAAGDMCSRTPRSGGHGAATLPTAPESRRGLEAAPAFETAQSWRPAWLRLCLLPSSRYLAAPVTLRRA